MASFADYVKDLMSALPTVNSNPMLSVTSNEQQYRENPFYVQEGIRKRIAEEQAAKQNLAGGGGGGMFGVMPTSSDTKDSSVRNAIQEREDALRAANLPEEEVQAIMAAEQEERGSKMNSLLTLLTQGIIPGATLFGVNQYGLPGYQDLIQGNMRNLMGDKSGYVSPLTQSKPEGVAAPVVSGDYTDAMARAGIIYDPNAYSGGGGFVNSEGNAPGASVGEVGNASFTGEVGYDQ